MRAVCIKKTSQLGLICNLVHEPRLSHQIIWDFPNLRRRKDAQETMGPWLWLDCGLLIGAKCCELRFLEFFRLKVNRSCQLVFFSVSTAIMPSKSPHVWRAVLSWFLAVAMDTNVFLSRIQHGNPPAEPTIILACVHIVSQFCAFVYLAELVIRTKKTINSGYLLPLYTLVCKL